MGNVLFEVSFEFHFGFLIPIFILIFIGVLLIKSRKYYLENKSRETAIAYRIIKIVCGCVAGFVTMLSIILIVSQVHMYNKIVVAYKEGNYKTVEGYVENFDPKPLGGKGDETFEIDGVKFAYSDTNAYPGYNAIYNKDGVITENGQHLKIGYIYLDETYGNIIVYIEQLP